MLSFILIAAIVTTAVYVIAKKVAKPEPIEDPVITENYVDYFNRDSVKTREIKDTTYVVRAIGDVDGRGIMQLNVLTSKDEFYTYKIGDKLKIKRK